ncbi:beta-glucosidase family protein [Candidatus Solirubrobacter pratensis]|uniref:beta-glucosidase family protein n=1 Tax=Candidatus Solirubrobacter pratensis TaxID=1298857 RepID=UPI0004222B46|nr:glycoside hydrolase family 3 C-terminal domain-containing protein [Candidatus Solirubrobacter pratensis]
MEELLRARLAELDLEQKVRLLTGADFWALYDEPAAGLRRLVTSDGPAGVRGERWDEREPSANVPSPTALAATWDEGRIERLGGLLAAECRRKGVDVLLAPTVNLHRTPYGGRHFECFSEDPLLTARIGIAYVRGLQDAGVGATVKHYVANDSETERFTLDARVDERTLRELYMRPFEEIVEAAHPWAVMAAYNRVNGHTMTESPLLREVLKDAWEWDGLVMSDWFAGRSLDAAAAALDLVMPGPGGPWGDALVAAVRAGRVSEAAIDDKVLRILRLAARVGALEGVDAPAAPAQWDIPAELRATAAASFVLVRNHGTLLPLNGPSLKKVAVIGPNAAVARTLGGGSATVFPPYTVSPLEGLRAALPHAEVTYAPGVRTHERLPVAADMDVVLHYIGADLEPEPRRAGDYHWNALPAGTTAVEAHATLRADTAGEYVIGASGTGRLRLSLDGKIAFDELLALGPDADPAEAHMFPPQKGAPVTLAAGEEVGIVLRYDVADGAGSSFDSPAALFKLNVDRPHGTPEAMLEEAVAVAREADVAILVVGTTEEVESEGFDRSTLALPGLQDELVRRVNEACARTVAIVNAGAPVLLPWADRVPAILLSWFPGQEAGNALADVLLGAVEPGGRLPTTWPASEAGLPSSRPVDGVLEYAEGTAIGYRRPGEVLYPFGHGHGYTSWDYLGIEPFDGGVRVRVVNSGTRRGRDVVQVYAARPELRLVGFAGVEAEPGEQVDVEIAVPERALARWDGGWVVEPGDYELSAGRSVADLRVSTTIAVAGSVAH